MSKPNKLWLNYFRSWKCIVKTQRNSTQLKTTLKQLALELDIVVACSTIYAVNLPIYAVNLYHKLYFYYKEWS